MRKKLLLSGLFMLFCVFAMAQQRTVTGTVTSTDGTPLADASVIVVGQKTGVRTDADGSFTINLPAKSHILQISYVGSETQRVDVADLSSVKVVMKSSTTALTDVVIIGYGSARKKDYTGAVSSIKAKDFNQGVINSPDQLLQNKVPGLEVTNTSGQPGAATTIQIRGTSSIRAGNNPLYVVDGVPLDGGTARPNIGNAFGSTPNSDPLLFIDPNTIAQIDVLKDASGTAIYGSRGANGVVMITTKKGGSGPMRIDAGVSFSAFAGYMKRFEVLSTSQYRSALKKYNEPATLDGGTTTDALKAITQDAISQNYSLALSGGNETGKYRATFLAADNNGFLKKSDLKKYLATFNGQYNFIDNKLSIDFGLIAGNFGESLTPVANTSGSTGNVISSALSWNPTAPLRTSGKYNFPSTGSGNPLAIIDAYDDKTNVSAFLGNISAAYKILPNLSYKFLFGINYETGSRKLNEEGWLPGFPGLSGLGNAAIATDVLRSYTIDHTLNYTGNISTKFSVDALAGYEYFKTDFSGGGVTAAGFNTNLDYANRISVPYTNIMTDAQTQNPYYSFANPSSELQSYFGRATFNYDDRYLLTGTFRADGSSKFGTNNKYGYFPSVAAKWQINNESFMKTSTIFSNLGLRASYGITGNQEFPAGSGIEQVAIGPFNTVGQINVKNPDLKWEETKQFNVGLDFGVAKGKIYGSIDYYNKKTSDILFSTVAIQPAPSATAWTNLKNATLTNDGIEVALGATIVDTKDFTWDVAGNFAHNHNVINNFNNSVGGAPLQIITGEIDGQGVSGTLSQIITNGYPVNEWYLKPFQGFDQNGNQTYGGSPVYSGNPNPTVLAGFSTTLRWTKFTLGVNMGGSFGYLIYNNTATAVTNIAGIAQGRNIDLKAYNSQEKPGSPVAANSRFLEKGDYWKLRNATLRYNFGNAGKYFKNISAYISGSNLFVITKFSGFDPEVNIDKTSGGYPSRSVEYIPYPTPRTLTLGLNFSL
ncbi:SusC/RagA family TonB-linked outer membrane protein [Ginsengibacter hankyongi]|uniref:SusC/RagA family TonB-linked outer membrane protein n=1 Tax=Ginsengibacter hankyongi TaxID=2607284 RepID=A0A5J5IGS5_9BACT|nr:SusC/RagA family TonB-linked outer membrane protein [Ginsengibacter hankyongi]KAA9038174.1 SusC/RagA family TonB-linked outer membrane protein [Ginsengibacter hankyongi]